MTREHFLGLDLLRIFAASLVLLNHFALFGWSTATATPFATDAAAFPILSPFAGLGAIGVQIFFVISGFVIALSAEGIRPVEFAKRRAIRVLPALWICGLIALVARALYGEPLAPLVADFFRSAVLSPIGPYIDGVVWTLVVEAAFYGLIFVAMFLKRFITLELVARVLGLASCCFLAIFIYAAIYRNEPGIDALYQIVGRFPFKVFLLHHGVFFAVGILIYSMFKDGYERRKLAYCILFGIFGMAEISTIGDMTLGVAIAANLIWLAALAFIAVSIHYRAQIQTNWNGRQEQIRNLGRLSYPLYLNHYSLGMVLVPFLAAQGFGRPEVLVLSMGFILGTSWLIMSWPEISLQKYLKHKVFAGGRPVTT